MLKGGGIATRGTGQALKKGGMADMITAKMSKKKKGKMMKGGKAMAKNKKSKKADMLTAKMSKDKKGRAVAKGKR